MTACADRLAERIRREGPIPFDAFVEEALYGDDGFFGAGRGAGRAGGDFVTSPEVGSLFGTLVAREIDGRWADLGRPDPFLVVDAGAGRGRLAADVLAADPACAAALRLVLVERSPALRAAQRAVLPIEPVADALGPSAHAAADDEPAAVPVTGTGPIVASIPDLPALGFDGVVLANELLDNLPFRVVERAPDGWLEVRVGLSGGELVEAPVVAEPALGAEADRVARGSVPVGTRLPVPTGVREWIRECAAVLSRGVLLVVDYVATSAELVERGMDGWLRTYRGHERGGPPLTDPGSQDLTIDVPVEYLADAARAAGFSLGRSCTQAEWLEGLGIEEVVADARAGWRERAHVGDLDALRHRSRVSEAAALVDPSGLGDHGVLTFLARMGAERAGIA